jgi:hypothetical protein
MHLNDRSSEMMSPRSKDFRVSAATKGTQISSLKPYGSAAVQESRPDLESREPLSRAFDLL